MSSNDNNVIDFIKKKKIATEQPNTTDKEQDESSELEKGITMFLDQFLDVEQERVVANGFITLTFNPDKKSPEVIIAGEIDPLPAIGALEHAKSVILNQMLLENIFGSSYEE